MTASAKVYDLAVVGAGIVGLAHAYAAARIGKRVVVIERDARAVGASIRNFGFITVTGQPSGDTWRRAMRSRDVWADVAREASIAIAHKGLFLTMRRPESLRVAEAFLKTDMGIGCTLLHREAFLARFSQPGTTDVVAALWSPHELRVESRDAIPQFTAWLEERWGVDFLFGTAAQAASPPRIATSRGTIEAESAIVCPGDDLATLFPDRIARYGATKCRLSMLRLADPGFRLPAGLMSDLGLVRYRGYADLPETEALRARLEREQPAHLAHGVHLIAVQSADGSLIVGDSHHYDDAPWPFAAAETERLILDELRAATGIAGLPVLERWTGTYATARDPMFVDAPSPSVRIVVVTSGTGASTGFGIAEEVIGDLYGHNFGATT
ncbi:MAG TPA: TIGR03364 family FAD-dependent oxidoreductase [Rhizomicrobium sp.]|nr:TIGR03364 family FAD-dependent oxidoreductase [Rhizomicrobium sp.]